MDSDLHLQPYSELPSTSCIVPTHTRYLHLSRNPEWPSLDCISWRFLLRSGWKQRATTSVHLGKRELLNFRWKRINMSHQISWTLYLTKKKTTTTQALCSGLDSNREHQSSPSLNSTHIHTSNHRICLHTEKKRINTCFLLDCTTRLESRKRTDLPTSCSLAEPSAPCSEINRTELTDFSAAEPRGTALPQT